MSQKIINQLNQQKQNPNDNWETPNIELKKAMVNYDILPFLDVCATENNAKFSKYFTEKDNALSQDWNMDFFMNPPYSQIKTWMKKAYDEHKKHNVDGLILTQSKTDTEWWHTYVEPLRLKNEAEVYFVKSRIKFLIDGKIPTYCQKCKQIGLHKTGYKTPVDENNRCKMHGLKLKNNPAPFSSVWIIYRREI